MPNFNEHTLELAVMELFKDEGYTYVNGEKIPRRDMSEVLLTADLKAFLKKQYPDITDSEIDGIILSLKSISGTIYEANKSFYKLLCDGLILNREDRSKKDIYISLLDFETPENNDFKIVNQFEIEGINNQKRIPDAIVFVNGLPLVVFEFKSAVREETTIADAYTQLTVRSLSCSSIMRFWLSAMVQTINTARFFLPMTFSIHGGKSNLLIQNLME